MIIDTHPDVTPHPAGGETFGVVDRLPESFAECGTTDFVHRPPKEIVSREVRLEMSDALGFVKRFVCEPFGDILGEEERGWHGAPLYGQSGFIRQLESGARPAELEEAGRLVEEIAFQLDINTSGRALSLSPAGGAVSTPRFLQGRPDCMYRREPDQNNRGLLRVLVDPSSSACVDDAALAKRQAAVIALVQSLALVRPVELWLVSCGRPSGADWDTVARVRVSTHPLNVSAVAVALSQSFTRRLMYGLEFWVAGYTASRSLHWPSAPVDALLRLSPTDVVVPPLHSNRSSEMLDNPAKWVLEQVEAAVRRDADCAARDVWAR